MFRKEIQGLGRVVSEKGVSLTPENMKSVVEWPIPNNRKEVETFLGYMKYHLKDFAALAARLHDLTKSKSTFLWGEAQNNSFHSLGQSMSSPVILAFPKPDCLFILDKDTSDHAVGAELSQVQNGREVLISYASKTLSAT